MSIFRIIMCTFVAALGHLNCKEVNDYLFSKIWANVRLQELGGRADSHRGSNKTTNRLWSVWIYIFKYLNYEKYHFMLDWAEICPTSSKSQWAELWGLCKVCSIIIRYSGNSSKIVNWDTSWFLGLLVTYRWCENDVRVHQADNQRLNRPEGCAFLYIPFSFSYMLRI